ncbi:MAG TPA: prepilin-type N-terminal cleavage/methylation domain-containing protein [Gemmatimonadales bacterium]|nr:prepilin-type N-terminal cleavage/methylation domain-containing protein [Gemmatimonadales bacterium]
MFRDRRGFTLIEVLVALTVGVTVVLVAHQLFAAIVDQGKMLTGVRTALDRAANARRWLRVAFLSLDVGTEGTGGFDGRQNHATFTTWLLTPDGWFERRQVELGRERDALVATITPGSPIRLIDSVTDVELDYLFEPGGESRWVREWVSPVSAPLAVRIRVKRSEKAEGPKPVTDTLLLLVKERG